MNNQFFIYILSSRPYGTLYVGMTNDLARRIDEHKSELVQGFTKQSHVHRLVYFEVHSDFSEALLREKTIKKWRRDWKINLIERDNPQWLDLYSEIKTL